MSAMEKNVQDLIHKLEQTALKTEFSGVISLFEDTGSLYNKAFGYRDVKNKLPNTTNTRFGIASGTKVFTALGIGKLIDQGVISLGTTIREIDQKYVTFIDEYATIQHLLTHTSGIYDYYDEEIHQDVDNFFVEIPWCELETPSDYYPLFKNKVMKFHPGERFSYSNGGYVFLGMLIEKLSGMLYRNFVQEHVLKAADMPNSGFYAFNDLPEDTAIGYLEDRKTTNIYHLPIRGGGDGGMYTTTEDLCSFWHKLFSNKILSRELTAIYLNTHWTFNDTDGYGCGIYKRIDNSMFSIVGGDAGVGFYSSYLVQEQLTINILSNITDGENAIRDIVIDFFSNG
ncbi:beta-lactamase [Candidatus Vecturithrix granuli]|uniref:Beta-lactamase n=1 Tax=Vecturithrix granuli TaxID=1499967 RepID=A0A0S6W6I6_VECG1|nr:beta-lactamase [Candidatus Vecturithrix granuli]